MTQTNNDDTHWAKLNGQHDHDGLVLRIAQKYRWALRQGGLGFDDLVQAGRMGVMRAQQTFDPERGFKFSTYASWWIRQCIARTCHDCGSTVRIPVYVQQAMRAEGRVSSFYKRMSLDHQLHGHGDSEGDDDINILDVLCPTEAPDSASDIDNEATLQKVREAVDTLPEKERTILRVRFWREGTLQDAADIYGFTRERARQIEMRALGLLKAALEGKGSQRGKLCPRRARNRARYHRLRELGYDTKDSHRFCQGEPKYRQALADKGVSE